MKLSLSAALVATMTVGFASAQASVDFDPINFLQFEGACSGDLLYAGQITGLKKIDEGKFCVANIRQSDNDGDKIVYSRLDVIKCTEDKVYENWFLCEDSDCANCDLEYRAYTSWNDIHPADELAHCYDYQYSTDSMETLKRNILGPLKDTKSVDFMFGPGAVEADVAKYRGFIHDNSCVALGKPTPQDGVVSVDFNPISFLQFDGTCSGDLLHAGLITGVKKMGEGKFCVSDILQTDEGDKNVYSRLDIIKCTEDKVYENWFFCDDEDCASCHLEFRGYTSWNDIHPDDELAHCYDYQYSTDDILTQQRNVLGPLKNTKSVDNMFGPGADEADVAKYRGFIHDNSCIALGQPTLPAGVVSADIGPITFLQYKDNCDGPLIYEGQITGVKKMDVGKFCVANIRHSDGGDKEVYSRLDVIKCNEDKVYENWFLCEDSDCANCDLEFRTYTSWNDIHPQDVMGHCYDHQHSTDDITALQRNILGPIENTKSVDYMFGANTSEDDVVTYRNFIHDNSCIALGQPLPPQYVEKTNESVEEEEDEVQGDVSALEGNVSASSVVSLTPAIIAMLWAVSMLL